MTYKVKARLREFAFPRDQRKPGGGIHTTLPSAFISCLYCCDVVNIYLWCIQCHGNPMTLCAHDKKPLVHLFVHIRHHNEKYMKVYLDSNRKWNLSVFFLMSSINYLSNTINLHYRVKIRESSAKSRKCCPSPNQV